MPNVAHWQTDSCELLAINSIFHPVILEFWSASFTLNGHGIFASLNTVERVAVGSPVVCAKYFQLLYFIGKYLNHVLLQVTVLAPKITRLFPPSSLEKYFPKPASKRVPILVYTDHGQRCASKFWKSCVNLYQCWILYRNLTDRSIQNKKCFTQFLWNCEAHHFTWFILRQTAV